MNTLDSETQALAKDVDGARVAVLRGMVDDIRRDLRRGRIPNTLAEEVEWEREFGPEMAAKIPSRLSQPHDRITFCRQLAQKYGVSYATVKDAFAGVWA